MKFKYNRTTSLFATIILACGLNASHAATYTWDPGNTANGTTIDPGNGTWNTTAGNIVWNNAGTNTIWSAANVAVFAGTDGAYAITVGGNFSAQKIIFSNSGYKLSASSAQTITVSDGNAPTAPPVQVASGKVATIGSNVTVQNNSSGSSTMYVGAATAANGGTLNIDSGGTLRSVNGSASVVINGNGTVVNVNTGGTLSATGLTGPGTGSGSIIVGLDTTSGASSTLNVEGGNVSVLNTGASALYVAAGGLGTVTLTSGTINIDGTNGLSYGRDAGVTSGNLTFNLDGGSLTTRIVREANVDGRTSIFNFNGGTLEAITSTTTFMQGINQANVKAGGAKIDTGVNNITIAQNLLAGSPSGGLTKSGTGTLTLTGTGSTYTGATVVKAGTLKVNTTTTLSTSSKITVGDTGSSGTVLDATTAGISIVSGQTLSGIGTVNVGSQSLAISGILAPGNSIGTLTVLGDVTWDAVGPDTWLFELGVASLDMLAASSGSDNDLLRISAVGSDFLKGSGSAFTFDFANTGEVGYYKLVDWDGTTTFSDTDFVATNLANGLNGVFIVDGTSSALYLSVIPEPSTALLGSFGVLALLRRRRRK